MKLVPRHSPEPGDRGRLDGTSVRKEYRRHGRKTDLPGGTRCEVVREDGSVSGLAFLPSAHATSVHARSRYDFPFRLSRSLFGSKRQLP